MLGGFGASAYMPMRASRSAKLIPAARTRTRTSPAPGRGSGRSSTFSTSGAPCSVITSARMARGPYLDADRAAGDEAVAVDDRVDHVLGHGRLGGHEHHRLEGSLGAAPFVVRPQSDGGRDHVDAGLAEGRPDAAEHAG